MQCKLSMTTKQLKQSRNPYKAPTFSRHVTTSIKQYRCEINVSRRHLVSSVASSNAQTPLTSSQS